MKEQLKLLLELQTFDAKLGELAQALKALPIKMQELRADLGTMESLVGREQAQLDETEAWRRKQESDLKSEEAQLVKAKQKAGLVKNIKEAMATERELESTRKMAKEREEEVLKLMAAVDQAKKTVTQHQADLAKFKETVLAEEEATKQKIAELEAETQKVKVEREAQAAKVEPTLLKRYSSIRMKRGVALAAVRNGSCLGCHTNIPPQIYNMLQRGTSVEICQSCNRLIYWEKTLQDGDGEPAAPTTPEATT